MMLLIASQSSLPSVRAVWIWALLFRLAGLMANPVLENDYFRFLWDGRVFALTGNPYALPPSASFGNVDVSQPFQEILSQINHPQVPSI